MKKFLIKLGLYKNGLTCHKIRNKYMLFVPNRSYKLIKAFKEAEYILDLKENFDNEGSIPYKIYDFYNAIYFVNMLCEETWIEYNKMIEIPKIYHSSNGSIDVLFENKNFKYLFNIEKESGNFSYYGFDSDRKIEKGKSNVRSFNIKTLPKLFN